MFRQTFLLATRTYVEMNTNLKWEDLEYSVGYDDTSCEFEYGPLRQLCRLKFIRYSESVAVEMSPGKSVLKGNVYKLKGTDEAAIVRTIHDWLRQVELEIAAFRSMERLKAQADAAEEYVKELVGNFDNSDWEEKFKPEEYGQVYDLLQHVRNELKQVIEAQAQSDEERDARISELEREMAKLGHAVGVYRKRNMLMMLYHTILFVVKNQEDLKKIADTTMKVGPWLVRNNPF